MEKMVRLVVLLLFMSFMSIPVFGQEEAAVTATPEEAAGVTTPSELPEEGVVTGTVASVDLANDSVVVKTDDGTERAFKVIEGETILWKGIEDIELANVTAGDPVEVGYYVNESGALIASWVDIIVAEETPTEEIEEEAVPVEETE